MSFKIKGGFTVQNISLKTFEFDVVDKFFFMDTVKETQPQKVVILLINSHDTVTFTKWNPLSCFFPTRKTFRNPD